MPFAQLGLADELVRLDCLWLHFPDPIQSEAIPTILSGRDLLAAAQTGTGKTAGFMLPLLQRLSQPDVAFSQHKSKIRALILTPTVNWQHKSKSCERIWSVFRCALNGDVWWRQYQTTNSTFI